jgi:hypothetical protein
MPIRNGNFTAFGLPASLREHEIDWETQTFNAATGGVFAAPCG